jgi:hypothetical protein
VLLAAVLLLLIFLGTRCTRGDKLVCDVYELHLHGCLTLCCPFLSSAGQSPPPPPFILYLFCWERYSISPVHTDSTDWYTLCSFFRLSRFQLNTYEKTSNKMAVSTLWIMYISTHLLVGQLFWIVCLQHYSSLSLSLSLYSCYLFVCDSVLTIDFFQLDMTPPSGFVSPQSFFLIIS